MIIISDKYPDLNLTNFPSAVDNQIIVEDVSIETKPLIDQYYDYMNNQDFTSAKQLLIDNPRLNNVIINAEKIQKMIHQIIAMQRFYLSDFQKHIESTFPVIKDEWNSTTKYEKFSFVRYNGLSYMAIESNIPIGTLPTNTNYFWPQSIKGDKGETGTGMTPVGVWNSTTQYYLYDLVSYDNLLYYSLTNNINKIPDISSNDWYCFDINSINPISDNDLDSILI